MGIGADAAALLLARVDTPGESGAAEAADITAAISSLRHMSPYCDASAVCLTAMASGTCPAFRIDAVV
jgi:hypothetical protein